MCSADMRACREEGTTRQEAKRERGGGTKKTPTSTAIERTAQSEKAAGERDGSSEAEEGTRVAEKKNSDAGGRSQEEEPPTSQERSTLPTGKGEGKSTRARRTKRSPDG